MADGDEKNLSSSSAVEGPETSRLLDLRGQMAEDDAIVWDFNFFNYCSLEAKWLTGATSNCLVIYLKSPETSQPREHYTTNPPCENLKACRANSKTVAALRPNG